MEKNEVLLHEGDGLMSAEELTRCKNAVCCIRCKTIGESGNCFVKRGSGFYAQAKLFGVEYRCIVTAHHVISCAEDALSAEVRFHFEGQNCGLFTRLRPDIIFHTNTILDYTVVGVDNDEMNKLDPPVRPIVYTEQPHATVGDDIFIFQHPQGLPKQFSYEKIVQITSSFIYYIADTDEGSSGSPVLWKLHLVAVHHKGNVKEGYNKGTLFSEIINDLHSGYNQNCLKGKNSKRPFSNVEKNIPQEMEENCCKRICKNAEHDSKSVDHSNQGANTSSEESLFPCNETLDKLAYDCCGFYKNLGRRLGVNNRKIEEISRDWVNYGSLPEKCFQVFMEWKESGEFTSTALEKALRSLDKNALASKYFP